MAVFLWDSMERQILLVMRIAHSDLPKWVQNGHFWGPKWSILATLRYQIGSQIGHFGVQNGPFWGSQQLQGASEHPFGGRLPSEYAHLGHLGPFGHMGGNGVFYPFLVHFDQMGK